MPPYTPTIFHTEVIDTQRLTANLARVTLGGEQLRGFTSSGFPDERVLLHLPDGTQRSYTIRNHDNVNHTLTCDMALHVDGPAARWAHAATVGERVGVGAPSGWYSPPQTARRIVLLADLSSLGAVGRILDEHQGTTPINATVEILDPGDRTTLASPHITWLASGNGRTESALDAHLRTLDLTGAYVWCAAEAHTTRRIRRHLRHNLGFTADRYHVMGYWRANRHDWERRYEDVRERVEAARDHALAASTDLETVRDAIDDELDRSGL